MYIFTNNFKHNHIIYLWKAFFATIIDLRLRLASTNFYPFCIDMRADDMSTFVANRGYYL